jgi:hypothetical protein
MSLAAGSKLGSYEILASLGGGGMGEVGMTLPRGEQEARSDHLWMLIDRIRSDQSRVTGLTGSYSEPGVGMWEVRYSTQGMTPRLRRLDKLVQQAWEKGETTLTLIHGHGRNRGISPDSVNTSTGYFGPCLRVALRNDRSLQQWILHSTLDRRAMGSTSVKLKPNPAPTREKIDCLPAS